MNRKKWEAKTEITPAVLKFREKRKWQIALRRYVLERKLCKEYAPYFALDIENMRQWFQYQFDADLNWDSFAVAWQFDHIIPVTYFDFSEEQELKLCWNFTNLRVEKLQNNKDRGNRLDILAAKSYFKELYEKTNYSTCLSLLQKIDKIDLSEFVTTTAQQQFIKDHWDYLTTITNYTAYEFNLLNSGKSIEEVNKERSFFKNLEGKLD
jgi:hypothetical protein